MSSVFLPDRIREVEERVVLEEALKDAVPCTAPDCELPAEWSLVCPACAAVLGLPCLAHKVLADRGMRAMLGAVCGHCKAPMPRPAPWRPL